MQQQKINFRKERDFGSVLGDSLQFIKANFKSFFGTIVLLVGPVILINGIVYGYVQSSIQSKMYNPAAIGDIFNADYFISMGLLFLLSMLTNILLSSIVYNYMCIYNEKPAGELITVSEVGRRVWGNIGRLTGSFVAFFVVTIVIVAIFATILIGLGTMLGIGFSILLGFAVFILAAIYIPVLAYFIPAGFYVVVRDDAFIFTALGKVRRYLSGNFWWTWLIMFVTLFGLGIIQTIFNLPASLVVMSKSFSKISGDIATQDSSLLLIILYTIGLFFSTCIYSISHLVSAFNFLSHEEKHEGKGMMSRIDEIN